MNEPLYEGEGYCAFPHSIVFYADLSGAVVKMRMELADGAAPLPEPEIQKMVPQVMEYLSGLMEEPATPITRALYDAQSHDEEAHD